MHTVVDTQFPRIHDPDNLSEKQDPLPEKTEGFKERLLRINRENTIEFDGSRGIGSLHVIRALAGMTNEGHAALMQVIGRPQLLDHTLPSYDRGLVVSADAFLRGVTDGINSLVKNEPYAPALREFWDIYRQCRAAFPHVFREGPEAEYI